MSISKIGILLYKEFAYSSRGYFLVVAIVGPVLISLLLSLVFGTLFSETPGLGIADEGGSRLSELAASLDSVDVTEYDSAAGLKKGVEDGVVDMGIVLPPGLDDAIARGERVEIDAYIWGESLARNRTILAVVVADLARKMAGQNAPVEVVTSTLGDAESIPWTDRTLPFIVMMVIMFGGAMVPATSLVNEKQKHTLTALAITPASIGEILVAKGLVGVILSLIMGMVILLINQAFGGQPVLLLGIMALGSVTAAAFGIFLGVVIRDISTLFASVKFMGIFLYAPALLYIFPDVPSWVARIFPTYYIIQPLIEVSQNGAGWSDIALEVFILLGLLAALLGIVGATSRRLSRQAA